MKKLLFTSIFWGLCLFAIAQPGYTANDLVAPYDGGYRPGVNLGIYEPWTDEQLGDLAAGNADFDLPGVGAKAIRPALFEFFVEEYGYDLRVPTYEHFDSIGLKDNTLIVGFPTDLHRDPTNYCPGVRSELFSNLYLDIWDNGENGTPVNDDNHYAVYIYKLIQHYGPYVKFWEIWNEPGFDFTGARGWAEPGTPGNWWENNPDPCDYKLRAPIFHYIRILRISWEVIKTLAPEDFVVVSGVGFPSFLDVILRNTDDPSGGGVSPDYPLTGGAYFDVMGYHAYPHFDGSLRYWDNNTQAFAYERHSDAAAQGLIESQDMFRDVLNKYGYNGLQYPRKHWMITECNVPRKAFDDFIGSTVAQRNFVAKGSLLSKMNDIIQLHIYKIGEDAEYDTAGNEFDLMGLYEKLEGVDPYFATPNESGISYKTTSDLIFELEYDVQRTAALNLPGTVSGGAFVDKYGNYTYALWATTTVDRSEQASATYSFPGNLNVGQLIRREWDYSNTFEQNFTGSQQIQLSGAPSFFTESGFSMDQSKGCKPLQISFNDLNTAGSLTRHWTFEGGLPNQSTDPNPVVVFTDAGKFEATLELKDANGNTVFSQSNIVSVEETPLAAFDSYHSGPMVVLTNQTALGADSFTWDFGDGTNSNEPNPTHVYYANGNYKITLTATNECGSDQKEESFDAKVPTTTRLTQTANDVVPPYDGQFRPGVNFGVYQNWSDEQLADISAGNVLTNVEGIGAKSLRPILDEKFLEKWGYDIRTETFQYYLNLGLEDNTLMVGFPIDEHRDPNNYCATDRSELFDNLYLDIWDNGENGTPVNDDNYYALYLYKTALHYKDYIKFWEIWNEPSFDYGGHGWKDPGIIGNWWENNPNPCDYKLKAPIFHYIRILRISYEVIKTMDPDAYVALSGVAFPSFLDAILRNTDNPQDGSVATGYEQKGGAYFDVMGFHTYPHFDGSTRYYDVDLNQFVFERHSDAAIRGIGNLQDRFTDLLKDYGYNGQTYPEKYWIITEANVPRKRFGSLMGSSELQRNYMIKAYVESVRRNFLQLHVYKISEEDKFDSSTDEFNLMGLYQKLDFVPMGGQVVNEEGTAFRTSSDLLYGTTYDIGRSLALTLPDDVDGGAFRDANGDYIYVLWAKTKIDFSETASATYSFPASLNITQLQRKEWNYAQTLNQTAINSQGIPLTGTPVFLTESSAVMMPPLAAFTADRELGCIPHQVQFENHSVRADSYQWTFPGGTPATSTALNPSVVYQTPGTYPVTLKVGNRAGEHAATYNSFIEVKTVPNSNFSFDVDGNTVEFETEVGYQDSILYFWYFGDGYSTGAFETEHTYEGNGVYEVMLTATNSCGTDTTIQNVYIQNAPIAGFTTVPTTICPPHNMLFFDLSVSEPEAWSWEFPGGIPATSTLQNPAVSYANPGQYEALLIVSNPYGSDTLRQSFELSAGIERSIDRRMCEGESLMVNGTLYDINNPVGMETKVGAGPQGCDSLIYINLSFGTRSEAFIDASLCAGEVLVVNGTVYDENRTSGTEVLSRANAVGCDSIVTINLTYLPLASFDLTTTICAKDGKYINGHLYNINDPKGTEIIAGGSANGCDSVVNVDLSFYPQAETFLESDLCFGEFVIVNGTRYDQSLPIGTEVIPNATSVGCDSVVYVKLNYYPTSETLLQNSYCRNANVSVNGTTYNANNPTGTELIPGGSANGCDSIIRVDFTFDEVVLNEITTRICRGEFFLLGNTEYGRTGTFSDTLFSNFGCDSVVVLNLTVLDNPIIETIDVSLCEGDTYNGVTFRQNTILIDSMVNSIGCDSLTYTYIDVSPDKELTTSVFVCEGRQYHGIPYFRDTTIVEVFTAQNGCDSLLTSRISVIANTEAQIVDTIRLNETYQIGNSIYTETGQYIDTLVNVAGCDSIVFLDLTVLNTVPTNNLQAAVFGFDARPNPFNDLLTIRFTLPSDANLQLDLIDLHGRVVAKVVEATRFAAGEHLFDLNQSRLAAGVYWCRLQVGEQLAVIKVVKL